MSAAPYSGGGSNMGYVSGGVDARYQSPAYYPHLPSQRAYTYPSVMLPPLHSSPDLVQYGHPTTPGQIHLPPPGAFMGHAYGYAHGHGHGHGHAQAHDYSREEPAAVHSGDDAYIPIPDDHVRRILGLRENQELSLRALVDPPPGERPGQPIPVLSQLAILGSPKKQLTLQGIYQALEDRFEWFRENRNDKSWQVCPVCYVAVSLLPKLRPPSSLQNSIRHNLSLYKCFRRIQKPITEPGKGSYWVVDYSKGSGTKRPRKRNKPGKKAQEGGLVDAKEEQESPEVGDEDEELMSPSDGTHDMSYAGHQVGQGYARTATRSIARRGGSPYGRAGTMAFPGGSTHGEQTQQLYGTAGRSNTYPGPTGQYPQFTEGSSRGPHFPPQ